MRLIALMIIAFLLSGCVVLDTGVELGKTVWGSSTRALEKARVDAIVKTYDKGYWEVLRLALEFIEDKGYVIFEKDESKGFIIVMGVKGSVNTTEVGLFFVEQNDKPEFCNTKFAQKGEGRNVLRCERLSTTRCVEPNKLSHNNLEQDSTTNKAICAMQDKTRIEVSSLSTNAKRSLAKSLFQSLDIAFGQDAKTKTND